MRALCGAIITAAALVGLGLTAIGIGTRYQTSLPSSDAVPLPLHQMDRPLVFALVFLTAMAVIGLGIAFLGLAYHHHRRVHEMTRHNGAVTTHTHTVT
jgi:multisubunit Na+/H+ antiporter MnhC subunit